MLFNVHDENEYVREREYVENKTISKDMIDYQKIIEQTVKPTVVKELFTTDRLINDNNVPLNNLFNIVTQPTQEVDSKQSNDIPKKKKKYQYIYYANRTFQ